MRKRQSPLLAGALLAVFAGAPVLADTPPGTITPANWPAQAPVFETDPAIEARIVEILGRMSLEEKVGQVIQADIASVSPREVRQYHLGSILNGGGSAPGGDLRAPPEDWLALADAFWTASTDTSDGGAGIPALWGTDAVHGHSNIVGATIFPHNIGLGMANDPDLMYEIGRVTALEMLSTGMDWTFAPTVAVVRDDRWGRTYEGYSEDPEIVAAYAPRIIEGIQGRVGTDEFLATGRMLATAKHYAGDGGTVGGKDQGDTLISEAEFRDIQAAAYPPAVAAGVQAVMASFNSFHGRKMHGHKEMLSDVLRGRMGFDGLVVGDWNGHGQIDGCTNTDCPASLASGLDLYMAPDSWKGLYDNLLRQAQNGEVSLERLDEAVARVLRVKLRAGLFEAGLPSSRPHAGDFSLLGAPDHRAVARDAVRKSLVLLKNNGGILPLAPYAHLLIAGDGADDIGKQSGGWTLSWQGTGNLNEHFPNGASIADGFREALEPNGGRVTVSVDGSFTERPDAAVVVFGEDPYAEFQGDRQNVDYPEDDGLALLRGFRQAGIPTVAVFITGRPLWVNPELNAADAFVAAWLPGSEGGGVADVLVGDMEGAPRHDFQGRLSYSWPRDPGQTAVNRGDEPYEPLFPYGYGLDYSETVKLGQFDESAAGAGGAAGPGEFLAFGDPAGTWRLALVDTAGRTRISDSRGQSPSGAVAVAPMDVDVQEDAIEVAWTGQGRVMVEGEPADFLREANGDMLLELEWRVVAAGDGLRLGVAGEGGEGWIDVPSGTAAGDDLATGTLKLSCFAERGADLAKVIGPLVIEGGAGSRVVLRGARIVANPGDGDCTP